MKEQLLKDNYQLTYTIQGSASRTLHVEGIRRTLLRIQKIAHSGPAERQNTLRDTRDAVQLIMRSPNSYLAKADLEYENEKLTTRERAVSRENEDLVKRVRVAIIIGRSNYWYFSTRSP